MDKLTNILGLLRDGFKRALGTGTDLFGFALDKAVSNPKATALLAGGAGLYVDPSWVIAAGGLVTRFGGFLATIGKAMGG